MADKSKPQGTGRLIRGPESAFYPGIPEEKQAYYDSLGVPYGNDIRGSSWQPGYAYEQTQKQPMPQDVSPSQLIDLVGYLQDAGMSNWIGDVMGLIAREHAKPGGTLAPSQLAKDYNPHNEGQNELSPEQLQTMLMESAKVTKDRMK
jgi:hypothetical protein